VFLVRVGSGPAFWFRVATKVARAKLRRRLLTRAVQNVFPNRDRKGAAYAKPFPFVMRQ
jgi:hypothetical protein